ncbi:MAG: hypothetical protein U0228_31185 [Myxococcaceae bacterium]
MSELIDSGQADHVLTIECGATFVRRVCRQREPNFDVSFATGDLQGKVDLALRIRATRAIVGYQPSELHEDYGATTFDVEAGAILAEGPRFSFEVLDEFDQPNPNAGSLIRVKETSAEEGPARFDFTDSNRIYILLSKQEFKTYLRVHVALPELVHSALVFPCLIRAIEQMRKDETEGGEQAGWRRKLRALLERDLQLEGEPEVAAAVLLKQPFFRATTRVFARLTDDE